MADEHSPTKHSNTHSGSQPIFLAELIMRDLLLVYCRVPAGEEERGGFNSAQDARQDLWQYRREHSRGKHITNTCRRRRF